MIFSTLGITLYKHTLGVTNRDDSKWKFVTRRKFNSYLTYSSY